MFLSIFLILLVSPLIDCQSDQTYKCPNGVKNGETTAEGQFVKLCTAHAFGYSLTIVWCLTPKSQKIEFGKPFEEDGITYVCKRDVNGAVGLETQVPKEKPGCWSYAVGDKWQSDDKKFQYTCVSDGRIELSACLTDKGEEVKVNASLSSGAVIYKCIGLPNGSVRMERSSPQVPQSTKPSGCGPYKIGEKYLSKDKGFQFVCVADGKSDITACFAGDGTEVAVGTRVQVGDAIYNCTRVGNSVKLYSSYPPQPLVSGCGKYKVGEVYNSSDNKFQITCVADGKTEVTACLTPTNQTVKVDTTFTFRGVTVKCIRLANGDIQFQQSYDAQSVMANNKNA